MQTELRKLPSVDKLLQAEPICALEQEHGHEMLAEAIRAALDHWRGRILKGASAPTDPELLATVQERLQEATRPTLLPVINATGVILHTNLGRAPLSATTLRTMQEIGAGYSNLEFNLAAGERGSRYAHAEKLLCRLTRAEAALVVNNNAGALLLILIALAQGREVIVSRGQLVEIGGGFRIPDVMAQSGARLVEVGTTNRTYARDFADAITAQTALLMRIHSSNFRVIGFTHEVELAELVTLGRERNLIVADDLGSGALLDTSAYGLAHEPMAQESVAAGADLVCFSGDKLLGGPQAGVIIGKKALVEQLKRHPLARALRVDKTTLAGIQANLLHYLKGEALREIPIWRMITMPVEEVAARAARLAAQLGEAGIAAEVISGASTVGGGSLPGETLPTQLLALRVSSPDTLAAKLRTGHPPVVARIEDDLLVFDLRTVLPEKDELLGTCIQRACAA